MYVFNLYYLPSIYSKSAVFQFKATYFKPMYFKPMSSLDLSTAIDK